MHTHRWRRCQGEGTCGHLLGDPHWICSCGSATDYPPGEQHFLTPERVIRGTQPPPEPPLHEPDWIVLRPGPNLPHTMMPPELDGLWVDRALLPDMPLPAGGLVARTVPAGELEAREDGAVGEVWWLEPVDPDLTQEG